MCTIYIYIMINSSIKNYKHSSRHENIFLCAIWEPQIGKQIPNFESILENLSGEANDLSKERSYAK